MQTWRGNRPSSPMRIISFKLEKVEGAFLFVGIPSFHRSPSFLITSPLSSSFHLSAVWSIEQCYNQKWWAENDFLLKILWNWNANNSVEKSLVHCLGKRGKLWMSFQQENFSSSSIFEEKIEKIDFFSRSLGPVGPRLLVGGFLPFAHALDVETVQKNKQWFEGNPL